MSLSAESKALFLLAVIGLAGCAPLPVGTPLRPEISRPALQQTLAAVADGPAFVRAEGQGRAWWNAFDDNALDVLIEMALRGNPSLAAAQARIERARQTAHLVEQESGVRYDSEASVVRQHLSENGLFPPPMGGSSLNEGDISVAAAYSFDWWGKNRALLQAALGESRAAEAEHGAAELALAAEVADTYFNWQGVISRSKLARRTVEARRTALRLAGSRHRRGIDSGLLSSQLELQLAQDMDSVRDLEMQSRILRDRLAALTGNGPDWALGLEEPVESVSGPFPLPEKLPLDWLAQRPDLLAMKWRAEAAAQRIDGARADFYPNVDMRLLLGWQSIDLGHWLSAKSWYGSVGPAVHIPLFNVATLRTKLDMRETDYAAAVAQYNQGLVTAANQVADALARVSALDARERLQRDAGVSAERTRQLQAQRYASGLSDRLPALDGEIVALAQHARESGLQAERKRAMAALFLALGGAYQSNRE